MFKIVVDDRERFDIEFFDAVESKEETVVVKQRLEVGDFAIWYFELLLFLIERKTWDDFAASIKDGRLEEQLKSLAAMADKGARTMLIIEGKLGSEHQGIERKAIEAKLVHIMVRNHKLQVIRTTSILDTVAQLCQLVNHYPADLLGGAPEVKIAKVPKTQNEIVAGCLSQAKGVSKAMAPCLLRKYTLRQILSGGADFKDIEAGAAGRKIGAARSAKLNEGIAASKQKIIGEINGVTLETAELILSLEIINSDNIANIMKGKRRLGEVVAHRVIDVLDHVYV